MASIIKLKTLNGKEFSFPNKLYFILEEAKNRIDNKFDAPIIITGSVGSGKSNLGFGLGGVWEEQFFNREFNLDIVEFSAEKFTAHTNKDDNFTSAIIFDEAIQGGSSRDGVSKIGNVLRKAMITKRYKKHLMVACVDSLKELNDKIVERCFVWIHVYYVRKPNGSFTKGKVKVFNPQQALRVYDDLKCKKIWKTEEHYIWKKNRIIINTNDFSNLWFSEEDYNKKKTKETNLLEKDENNNKIMNQRNLLIKTLLDRGAKQSELSKIVGLSRSSIADIKAKMSPLT